MPVLQSFTNGSNVFEANKIKMIANPNFKQQIYYIYIIYLFKNTTQTSRNELYELPIVMSPSKVHFSFVNLVKYSTSFLDIEWRNLFPKCVKHYHHLLIELYSA